ncbi:MAG: heparin lyase I family protein [Mobilicoccus sp.]|nr:heparin lyase I family protein [Mobilicoccus sp.]
MEIMVEGDAEPPMCEGDTWIFMAPGVRDATSPRRTEVFLAEDGSPVLGREGSVVVHDAEITLQLGPAGAGDHDWHVLWQLHGPTNGEWRPPPIGLRVRDGKLAVSGGAGAPGHNWRSANHEWARTLASVEDGVTYRVKVTVFLSADPAKGWVTAEMDGQRVVDRWHPVSPAGFRTGTLYPGQAEVASRVGLYRGSQGAPPPEYTQVVAQKVIQSTAR